MSSNISELFGQEPLETDVFANTQASNESHSGEPLVSDAVMQAMTLYVDLILRGIVSLFGVINNIVNMVIFFRLGLKDSMRVALMALSFTDFAVTLLGLAGMVCFAWDVVYPTFSFDPIAFHFVAFGWYRDTCYLISGWITTLMSVERCICVVSPFRVKQIFTRMRCIVAIIVLYVVHFAIHMPVFLSQKLAWEPVEVITPNGSTVVKSKMVVHFWSSRDEILVYIDIANGAVLPIPSQAIVLASVIWMTVGLRASSKVRVGVGAESGDKKKSGLSGKESRLVKVVLFLAIILTFCNIPRFLAVYAKQIFDDVLIGRKYANLYALMWNVAAVVEIINSSLNIFVYLMINSHFRQEFKTLFRYNKK